MKVPRWDDAVKRVKKTLMAERQEGDEPSNVTVERSSDVLSADGLVRAFSQAIEIMERENAFLKEDAVTEAVALLPQKTEVIDHLNQHIAAVQEAGSVPEGAAETLKALQGRFDDVAEQNRVLLQRSMDVQSAVMKILVDSAVQETQHGYGHTGKAGIDSSRSTFSLDSEA